MSKIKKSDQLKNFYYKIKVVGVGGAGCSSLERMNCAGILGIEYIAIDTDNKSLQQLDKKIKKIKIGGVEIKGLGTGGDMEAGQMAAKASAKEIKQAISDADLVFVVVGLGGGTGTGAGPVVLDLVKQNKSLAISVVTKPFTFEGAQRRNTAEDGLMDFIDNSDAVITICNSKLLQIIDKSVPILEGFKIADEALKQAVQSVADILTLPSLVNIGLSDIKAIMQESGSAFIGVGWGTGGERASQAAKGALKNPLLNLCVDEAGGIIFVVTGSSDLKMSEVNEVAEIITDQVREGSKVSFGAFINDKLKNEIKVTLIATKFNQPAIEENFSHKRIKNESVEVFSDRSAKRIEMLPLIDKFTEGKIKVYKGEDKNWEEEKGFNPSNQTAFEDELDIPAFLRKKSKEKKE